MVFGKRISNKYQYDCKTGDLIEKPDDIRHRLRFSVGNNLATPMKMQKRMHAKRLSGWKKR